MYEIIITQIRLVPFSMTKETHIANTKEEARGFIEGYLQAIPDIYNTDLNHKFDLAMNRYMKDKAELPYIFSHPEKGVLLRHIFEIKCLDKTLYKV